MQHDTFLVQQSCHTNVCNPAVRLKLMTFCFWCYFELAADFCDDGKKAHLRFPLLSRHWRDNTGAHHGNTFHLRKIFHFSGWKVPKSTALLLVTGRWYEIRFPSQLGKHNRFRKSVWLTFQVVWDIYKYMRAQAWLVSEMVGSQFYHIYFTSTWIVWTNSRIVEGAWETACLSVELHAETIGDSPE